MFEQSSLAAPLSDRPLTANWRGGVRLIAADGDCWVDAEAWQEDPEACVRQGFRQATA
jgi:hypothetical protein